MKAKVVMKSVVFVFLLVILVLVGCVPDNSASTSTLIPTISIGTSVPIVRNTPTSTLSSDSQCTEVKFGNLDELKSTGTIVLEDDYYKVYTADASTLDVVELTKDDEIAFSIAISPDRQIVAYELYSRNEDISKLVLMDSLGEIQLVIPWVENWTFISSWLDNQRLLINDYDELSDGNPWLAAKEFSTFLAVNPFTGEQELLQPDFPNIYSHHMFPSWTGFGSTVYSPDLNRVVYVSADTVDGGFHYIVWDIDEQYSLADFRVIIGDQNIPKWSPDGEKVAIAFNLFYNDSNNWPAYDLYLISQDGNVKQVTDLSKYYTWNHIGSHSWSLDSKYIAFWYSGWTEQPEYSDLNFNQQLAVVDTETNDLSIYCVTGRLRGDGTVPPPVWSPDGRQILIESPLSEYHSQVLLLDLDRKTVAGIGEDMTPIGWMITP